MLWFGALAVAAPLPMWEDLLRPEFDPTATIAFAPHGSGILWRTLDGDTVDVHLRWLPEGEAVEPLTLERPKEGRVVAAWGWPVEPRAAVFDGERRGPTTDTDPGRAGRRWTARPLAGSDRAGPPT